MGTRNSQSALRDTIAVIHFIQVSLNLHGFSKERINLSSISYRSTAMDTLLLWVIGGNIDQLALANRAFPMLAERIKRRESAQAARCHAPDW
jgi:hypothetical protein